MKQSLDLKSTMVGFLCAFLLIAIISFKNSVDQMPGRYQAISSERNVVILDTQNGNYMIGDFLYPKSKLIKGNFESKRLTEEESKKD